MKKLQLIKALFAAFLLLSAPGAGAQKTASIDLAYVHNVNKKLYGINVSGFYHFNERLVGGIEMNRFVPIKRVMEKDDMVLSAWDFDLNLHYLVPLSKTVKFYPLTGISHTSEKEVNSTRDEIAYERFWSFNTGAGLLFTGSKLMPHIEYMFTWGHLNQQFLLAGFSYEIEWGKKEKK